MNKKALVTGTSKGIGQAIAIDLAKQGFEVCCHFHKDQQGAQTTLDLIKENGGQGQLMQFDISDRQQCLELLEQHINEFGAFFCIVNNAGFNDDGLFASMDDEQWDSVVESNLHGFYNVIKPCLLPMIKLRKGGRIITVSSIAGVEGNAGQVNYAAAKAGIIGATKALALEVAKRKITVNCVAPGIIDTDMTKTDIPQSLLDEIPMKRIGKVWEVSSAVAYLASENASFITKQVLRVDGGI